MTNAHGTFIWYELLTTDPDAATDFYGKVVGGHRSGRITTHYSAVELKNLIDAGNKVQRQKSRKSPTLFLLKRTAG